LNKNLGSGAGVKIPIKINDGFVPTKIPMDLFR
jgi:hypothetical protein